MSRETERRERFFAVELSGKPAVLDLDTMTVALVFSSSAAYTIAETCNGDAGKFYDCGRFYLEATRPAK
jgi:hypothetical protein